MKPQRLGTALLKTVGYVLLFQCSQRFAAFLVQMVLTMGLTLGKGLTAQEANQLLPQLYYGVLYETMLIGSLIFLGFLFLMHRSRFLKKNNIHSAPASANFAGLLGGFACYLIAGYLVSILELVPAVQQSQSEYVAQHEVLTALSSNLWAELLYACLAAPLVEEILCRGAILGTLKRSMSAEMAILTSGLVFSLIHGNLYQITFTLPLGIVMGYLAHRMGSIWPSVMLHIAFNSTNYLIRLGDYLGYPEGSEMWMFCYWAATIFCAFAIPLSLILYRMATQKVPAPIPAEIPHFGAPASTWKPYGTPPREFANEKEEGDTMAAPEYMIVGLGNPGEKYASNRHNMGFMALDYIALREKTSINNLRFRALTGETVLGGKKVLLVKPQTYMNSSGEAVREAAAFYKIPPERILVIFDDISFQPGVFRIRKSGSAGGHNGIKSIISCLSSDAFPRIKMGVGTPPPGWELMNWVLGNPSKEDLDHIISSMEDVYCAAKLFVADDLEKAAGAFNGKTH